MCSTFSVRTQGQEIMKKIFKHQKLFFCFSNDASEHFFIKLFSFFVCVCLSFFPEDENHFVSLLLPRKLSVRDSYEFSPFALFPNTAGEIIETNKGTGGSVHFLF